MLKAYEFRIYPTQEQEQFLLKTNGLCRLYWNTCLAEKEKDHKLKIESAKVIFSKFKPEAAEWIKEIDSTSLAGEWNAIASAFSSFFKSIKGERKSKVNKPKFKSRKTSPVAITWSSMAKPRILKNGYLFLTKKIETYKR